MTTWFLFLHVLWRSGLPGNSHRLHSPNFLSSQTRCFAHRRKGGGGGWAGSRVTPPCVQSVIALCEEKMQLASSCRLCRSLSAVGRRVLSIESFGAFQGEHAAYAPCTSSQVCHTPTHMCTGMCTDMNLGHVCASCTHLFVLHPHPQAPCTHHTR